MATWRYLFHDILSNQFLAELPLEDVDFTRQLPIAGPGSFAALLRLGDSRVSASNWRAATEPRQTVVYTDRDGVLLACHVIWDTTYHVSNQTLELSGSELWSYFQHRYISGDRTYSQVDQFDIARDLLRQEFGQPNGDILVQVDAVGTTPLSGRLRDRTYLASDAKLLSEAVEQLSQVIDGFDFDLQVGYNPDGTKFRKLVLAYPRLGQADSGLYFRLPGDLQDFDWPRQGSKVAARAIAIGANGLRQDALDWGQLSPVPRAAPLLEIANTYSDVSDTATLLSHAQSDLSGRTQPVGVPSVVTRADQQPVLGSYGLGDSVWLVLEDSAYFAPPWLSPDGGDYRLRQQMRLVGLHIRPDADTAELILNTTDAINARVANSP